MERLSDTAIDIINDLHTERLEYTSEYIPLIDSANKLAKYEDLEEQGRLIKLPCKVGTRIYKIVYYLDREFCNCCIDDYGYDCKCKYYDDENNICLNKIIDNERYKIISKQFNFDMISNIGRTVFLTKEEAEAKLREMEEK